MSTWQDEYITLLDDCERREERLSDWERAQLGINDEGKTMAADHKLIPTTAAVYTAILSQHAADLVPFVTISQPDGNPYGDPEQARMYTEWGFKNADYPTIALDNTWRHDRENHGVHNDDKRTYYICVALSRD